MEVKGKSRFSRVKSAGFDGVKLDTRNHIEWHVTFTPLKNESPDRLIDRFINWFKNTDARIIKQEIFGGLNLRNQFLSLLNKKAGTPKWPILWSQGKKDINSDFICGMNIMAISGTAVETIYYNKNVIGCLFNDGYAQNLILGELYPMNTEASRSEQITELFEVIENILRSASMDYSNVIRTWFFLDDINSWYGDFNKVRTAFYKEHGVFDGVVPASTGIAGINPRNAAVMAGIWAVKSDQREFGYEEVPSPLQCPAPRYGSSFSRALEMYNPEFRRLFISGTASIKQDGNSAFVEDLDGQINLTMEVVEAILISRRMSLNNISRSTGYFKHWQDIAGFDVWKSRYSAPDFPITITQADVCRPELLFEIEADALMINDG